MMLCLVLAVASCKAQETCKQSSAVGTPAGELTMNRCTDANKYPTRKFVAVAGTTLIESRNFLSEESTDNNKSRWIFRADPTAETGCPDRLYLLDTSVKPLKLIAFGVKKACNEFQAATWGEKRSVIVLKANVRFVYEGGKLTLPEPGEKLWRAIAPPQAGNGLDVKDAKAFSEEIPAPK